MGVAHVLTIAVGLRYGTYRYLADDLQVRGADIEGEYALLQHVAVRGTLGGETATYRDAFAHAAATPVRPYFALGAGIALRHQTYDAVATPTERTIVAPYLQLAQVGIDVDADVWLVRGSLAVEGVATSAPPVWAIVVGVGRRF